MPTALIIDDEPDVREGLRVTLEHLGYEVYEACDGQEGIDAFKQKPADLVVTDIFMPQKDGIEVIRELRALSTSVTVVAASGRAGVRGKSLLRYALDLGADYALKKPIDMEEIEGILRSIGKAERTKAADYQKRKEHL